MKNDGVNQIGSKGVLQRSHRNTSRQIAPSAHRLQCYGNNTHKHTEAPTVYSSLTNSTVQGIL